MPSAVGFKYAVFSALMPVFDLIYPLPEVKRERTVPMRVLALGPSRTGTESLKTALQHLGYEKVYHGWIPAREHMPDARSWVKLLGRKSRLRNDETITPPRCSSITLSDLDAILGPYDAVTDVPCMCFAPELIAAYPDAKVILNRRKDYEMWERSMINGPINGTDIGAAQKLLGLFSAETFWAGLMHHAQYHGYFNESFVVNARRGYDEHYERLEKALPPGSWLDWTVEDGWEPLCKFLGKEVPADTPFPRGNASAVYEKELQANIALQRKKCLQNFKSVVVATAVATCGIIVALIFFR